MEKSRLQSRMQELQPHTQGLLATTTSLGIALLVIRTLGGHASAYKGKAIIGSLLIGGGVYWLQTPEPTLLPPRPGHEWIKVSPDFRTRVQKGREKAQELRQQRASKPLPPLPTPPSPDLLPQFIEAVGTFEQAVKDGASRFEIRARLKELLAYTRLIEKPQEGSPLLDLIYGERSGELAKALAFGGNIADHLDGLEAIRGALAEGEVKELNIDNRGPAGFVVANRRAILPHTGTLTVSGEDLTRVKEAVDTQTFEATGLIITTTDLPDLGVIREVFPKLQWIEIQEIESLKLDTLSDEDLALLNKTAFPNLHTLSIRGDDTKVTPLFYGLPQLKNLRLDAIDASSIPFAQLYTLEKLEAACDLPLEILAACCPFLQLESLEAARKTTQRLSPLATCFAPFTAERLGPVLANYPGLVQFPPCLQVATALSLPTEDLDQVGQILAQGTALRSLTLTNGNISTDVVYLIQQCPNIVHVQFPSGAKAGRRQPIADPHLLSQICHLSPFKENLQSVYSGPLIGSTLFQIPATKHGVKEHLFHPDHRVIDVQSCALWLAHDHYKKLRKQQMITTLHLDDQPNLTDETLLAFVRRFRNVKTISLQRCPKITSTGIQNLLGWWLPKLHAKAEGSLNLTGCTGLDKPCFVNFRGAPQEDSPLEKLSLIIDETTISGTDRRHLEEQRARLPTTSRIDLLNHRLPAEIKGQEYSKVLEWYKNNRERLNLETSSELTPEGKQAYLELYHTNQVSADASITTLGSVLTYARDHAPILAKQVEEVLCYRVSDATIQQLYVLSKCPGLPALESAVLSYAVATNSSWLSTHYQGKRFDPTAPQHADFKIQPCIAGTGANVEFGKALTLHRALLKEGEEFHQEFQPGYQLYTQDDFSWSDIAFQVDNALSYFHALLYNRDPGIILDVELAHAVYGLAKRGGFERIVDKMSAWASAHNREYHDADDDHRIRTMIEKA